MKNAEVSNVITTMTRWIRVKWKIVPSKIGAGKNSPISGLPKPLFFLLRPLRKGAVRSSRSCVSYVSSVGGRGSCPAVADVHDVDRRHESHDPIGVKTEAPVTRSSR